MRAMQPQRRRYVATYPETAAWGDLAPACRQCLNAAALAVSLSSVCTALDGGRTPLPSDLKKYRRDLVSSELLSDTEIIFFSRQKASNQQTASERRAVKEDELRAELKQQGQRDGGARRRLSHLQQLADQRRAQLQQRVADMVVHLAQHQLKNLR